MAICNLSRSILTPALARSWHDWFSPCQDLHFRRSLPWRSLLHLSRTYPFFDISENDLRSVSSILNFHPRNPENVENRMKADRNLLVIATCAKVDLHSFSLLGNVSWVQFAPKLFAATLITSGYHSLPGVCADEKMMSLGHFKFLDVFLKTDHGLRNKWSRRRK